MTDQLHTVITGLGLWAEGFAGAPAWLSGAPDPERTAPTGEALDRRSRRRASRLTRALSDVIAEAVAQAHVDLATAPTVFGSALGEAETMIGLLDQMWRERTALSPTAFAMSVHNAASGLVSIAAGNRGFTTSLAADYDTPAASLFEAVGLVVTGGEPVVVTCADEAAPKDLVPTPERFDMLATAVVVAPADAELAPDAILATMRGPFLLDGADPTTTAADAPDALARNPQAGLLDLVDAVLRRRYGVLRLDHGRGTGWAVEIGPPPTA